MHTVWAQRREEVLNDCIVSPDVFHQMVECLAEFVVPYQHVLETEAGQRNVHLGLVASHTFDEPRRETAGRLRRFLPTGRYEGALSASCEHMRILPPTSGRPWQIPLYPLRLKVGKNLPYHVVYFCEYV